MRVSHLTVFDEFQLYCCYPVGLGRHRIATSYWFARGSTRVVNDVVLLIWVCLVKYVAKQSIIRCTCYRRSWMALGGMLEIYVCYLPQ